MWIARDKNGNLNLFQTKPIRKYGYKWEEDVVYKHSIELDNSLFPDLSWEDEPEGVCLCLNNEKYHTVKLDTLDKLYDTKERFNELQERIDKFNSLPRLITTL